MTTSRKPRAGANRRRFEPSRRDEIDRTQWLRPERPTIQITMPATSFRIITDEDVGLVPHEGAQLRAEDFLRIMSDAWMRNRRRAA